MNWRQILHWAVLATGWVLIFSAHGVLWWVGLALLFMPSFVDFGDDAVADEDDWDEDDLWNPASRNGADVTDVDLTKHSDLR